MKIAVCVKHAIDETELRVDSSGMPQTSGAVSRMSTFDKNAVEEGLRLKSSHPGEVVIFTVGTGDARKTLKEALAMGADRGVLISADPVKIDSLRTAEMLSAAIRKNGPFDVVLCAEGSSDTYSGQVPPMLGEILDGAYIGYAKKIEINGNLARIERSLEDSVEIVEASLPLVTSVISEINEPRYPTLIQIMQASKKPIEELGGDQLAPSGSYQQASIISMSAQSSSRKHVLMDGSPEEAASKLIESLAKEGVLTK